MHTTAAVFLCARPRRNLKLDDDGRNTHLAKGTWQGNDELDEVNVVCDHNKGRLLASIRAIVWLRPYLTKSGLFESYATPISEVAVQDGNTRTHLGLSLFLLRGRLGESVGTSILVLCRLGTVLEPPSATRPTDADAES